MKWKAARTAALLSVLFFIVYGGTNWLSSQRGGIGSYFFEWERGIAFVPLAIVPYMSIDLFFVAAPFLCRSDRELKTLARRIIAAILVSGACFLFFPLKFAFERPTIDGWLGVVFDWFRGMDQPFNQLPSLHIALAIILANTYGAHTRGVVRIAVCAWFVLIGLSAVLTYQHHVIDIAGGLALGVACLHLIQDEPLRQPVVRNPRIGSYYLGGALLLMALSVAVRPWSLLLLWPAGSLLLTAAAYSWLGPGIFRKRDGRLPLTTWLLLWPVLAGQHLSLWWYSRQCRAWDRLTDRVLIGRVLAGPEAEQAVTEGVTAVLDLTGEFAEMAALRRIAYCQMPVLDLTAPPPQVLDRAVQFIDENAAEGVVYVHCKIGYSRTAAVAGAHLLHAGVARDVEEAIRLLRSARPTIVIRPEAMHALRAFYEQTRRSRGTVD